MFWACFKPLTSPSPAPAGKKHKGMSVWSAVWEPRGAPGKLGLCRGLNSLTCSHRASCNVSVCQRWLPASGFWLRYIVILCIFLSFQFGEFLPGRRVTSCVTLMLWQTNFKKLLIFSFFLGRFVGTTYKCLTCWTRNRISHQNLFILVFQTEPGLPLAWLITSHSYVLFTFPHKYFKIMLFPC